MEKAWAPIIILASIWGWYPRKWFGKHVGTRDFILELLWEEVLKIRLVCQPFTTSSNLLRIGPMIIGWQLQDVTRMLHLSVWGCFLHLVGHEAEIRMELFSKLFPDLTLANLMLKASGPSCNNSSHFLPIPFLTLRHMFSSRRGESGYTSSWSFKSRSISCLTNAFPSLLLLKFWGRACGNAGWMTSKKEYDGVQDNSISIQPNLGPLELFTCLENPRNQPKQRIWIPCIHMRWKVAPHEKVCPPRAHLFVGVPLFKVPHWIYLKDIEALFRLILTGSNLSFLFLQAFHQIVAFFVGTFQIRRFCLVWVQLWLLWLTHFNLIFFPGV